MIYVSGVHSQEYCWKYSQFILQDYSLEYSLEYSQEHTWKYLENIAESILVKVHVKIPGATPHKFWQI